MDFAYTDDQVMIKDTARKFLENECPVSYVRDMFVDKVGSSPELWAKIVEQGWLSILVPEEYGGMGLGFIELMALQEEFGRALLPGPFFATAVLGGLSILYGGSEDQKKTLLPPLAQGEKKYTLALQEMEATFALDNINLKAEKNNDGYVLNGEKMFVQDAHLADGIITAARTSEEGITLFMVERESEGLKPTLLRSIDGRKRSHLKYKDVSVSASSVLGEVDKGLPVLKKVCTHAAAALCGEMLGGMTRILEMTTEYAKQRVQFGRLIGSFQAVQHKAANMLTEVECARSSTYYANMLIAEGAADHEVELAVSAAKAWCNQAYDRAVKDGLQLHGGIAFTWEHDLHLYLKRSKALELTLGDTAYHRERVAALLDL